MRSLANISIACIFALMVLGKNGWAQSTVLSGENTIIFPYVDVPFLQSYTVISEGTKNSDGSCSFPLDSEAAPYPLTDTQRWITVQRAFDPDSCQELIEKGVVDLSINPEVQELLSLPGADAAEAFIKLNPALSASRIWLSAPYQARQARYVFGLLIKIIQQSAQLMASAFHLTDLC